MHTNDKKIYVASVRIERAKVSNELVSKIFSLTTITLVNYLLYRKCKI